MKNLLLTLSIFSILIITSCGSDDTSTNEVGLSGTIVFDGDSYTIANGIFTQEVDDGAAVGDFFMSDGTLTATSTGASSSDAEIIISVTAIHEGADVLGSGAYITNSATQDQYAFVSVTTGTSSQSFTGGTVNISGSGNTYNVTFVDVPFGQGVTLTGTITGTYSNE